MCVHWPHVTLAEINPRDHEVITHPAGHDLDHRRSRSWIALIVLGALVGLLAACSGAGNDTGESSQAISGRWQLPADVLLVGKSVRLDYDDAPKWTNVKACGGKLLPGDLVLGNYLMDHFAIITSVGGYACRRNTADLSRMSVHGTGRALDVFIPRIKGGADNERGDKVANWLVRNAQSVGVQLIIWDHSIWRANGTNDGPYGGPIPHEDHIHVELTIESAAKTKQWWTSDEPDASDGDDGGSEAGLDGSDSNADAARDAGTPKADAATPPAKDAGTKDAGTKDATPTPDTDAGATEPDADAGEVDPASVGDDSADDEPGETSSLPDREPRSGLTIRDDDGSSDSKGGCSTAPGANGPLRSMGGGVALMLGLAAWLRRKRR